MKHALSRGPLVRAVRAGGYRRLTKASLPTLATHARPRVGPGPCEDAETEKPDFRDARGEQSRDGYIRGSVPASGAVRFSRA